MRVTLLKNSRICYSPSLTAFLRILLVIRSGGTGAYVPQLQPDRCGSRGPALSHVPLTVADIPTPCLLNSGRGRIRRLARAALGLPQCGTLAELRAPVPSRARRAPLSFSIELGCRSTTGDTHSDYLKFAASARGRQNCSVVLKRCTVSWDRIVTVFNQPLSETVSTLQNMFIHDCID